jgi:hypothetical protein
MIEVLLLTHAAATLVMVGVIWFVQIAHYPLMARVSAGEFAAYEREHQTRTTLVDLGLGHAERRLGRFASFVSEGDTIDPVTSAATTAWPNAP